MEPMTVADVLALPPHELDRLVAERVMGWKERRVSKYRAVWEDAGGREVELAQSDSHLYGEWSPSTDPAADLEVHRLARKWEENEFHQFYVNLIDLIYQRYKESSREWVPVWSSTPRPTYYEVGDYSRAALLTVSRQPPLSQ